MFGELEENLSEKVFFVIIIEICSKIIEIKSDFFFCIGVSVLLLQSEEHCYQAPPFPLSSFPYCCGD